MQSCPSVKLSEQTPAERRDGSPARECHYADILLESKAQGYCRDPRWHLLLAAREAACTTGEVCTVTAQDRRKVELSECFTSPTTISSPT